MAVKTFLGRPLGRPKATQKRPTGSRKKLLPILCAGITHRVRDSHEIQGVEVKENKMKNVLQKKKLEKVEGKGLKKPFKHSCLTFAAVAKNRNNTNTDLYGKAKSEKVNNKVR